MPLSTSFSQASLAATILASTIGTYIALSPPNPNPDTHASSTPDTIHRLNLASQQTTNVAIIPLALLSLHSSSLAYFHPSIPPFLLHHGTKNALNSDLITWSAATAIPLALILTAGIPLRLVSYASLGKNFTFALATPDRLNTTGIYRYVQHPSYTGMAVLVLSNTALLCRIDGVFSCWIPPKWYPLVRRFFWSALPVAVGIFLFGVWTRVRQEERMLRAEFGVEWEEWHSKTPRFVPWRFY